jgi:hypothetical protein
MWYFLLLSFVLSYFVLKDFASPPLRVSWKSPDVVCCYLPEKCLRIAAASVFKGWLAIAHQRPTVGNLHGVFCMMKKQKRKAARRLLSNFAQHFNTIDNAQTIRAPHPVELFFKKFHHLVWEGPKPVRQPKSLERSQPPDCCLPIDLGICIVKPLHARSGISHPGKQAPVASQRVPRPWISRTRMMTTATTSRM